MPFNVGDRVKCIDASNTVGPLIRNWVYTISAQSGHNGLGPIYKLEGQDQTTSYSEFRFELAVAEPAVPQQSVTRWIVIFDNRGEPHTSTHPTEEGANRSAARFAEEGTLLAKKKITLRY